MFNIARRSVLAAFAVTLSGLGIRRAAALPVPALSPEYHTPPFDIWPDGRRKHPFGATDRLADEESRIRADTENKRQCD